MKENSKEEAKRIIEKLISTMKSDREMFDEKTTEKEIYTFFINALEFILSDYKRVLKENEEYYKQLDLDYTENNFISKQIVKDNLIKYQEEYELLLEHQSGKESNRTKYLRGRIHMCQELLESEE